MKILEVKDIESHRICTLWLDGSHCILTNDTIFRLFRVRLSRGNSCIKLVVGPAPLARTNSVVSSPGVSRCGRTHLQKICRILPIKNIRRGLQHDMFVASV